MPKPIRATQNMIEETKAALLAKVDAYLEKLKTDVLKDGTIEFKMPYAYTEPDFDRPQVTFTLEAWAKMSALVCTTSSEIAWNGVVEREDETHFKVTDILVYPQKVASATVEADETERALWLAKIPFEERRKLNFYGHSHVTMSPTPSSTDMTDRKDVVGTLAEDGFAIFFIMNKSFDFTGAIYDMESNTLFDTKEIDFVVPVGEDLLGWVKTEKEDKLKAKTYGGTYTSNYSKSNVSQFPSASGASSGTKESKGSKGKESGKKKPLTKTQLQISASTIVTALTVGWLEADEILEELLESVNAGFTKNTIDDLLVEAEIIKEEHDAIAQYGNYKGFYGNQYGGQYGY